MMPNDFEVFLNGALVAKPVNEDECAYIVEGLNALDEEVMKTRKPEIEVRKKGRIIFYQLGSGYAEPNLNLIWRFK